MYSKLFICSYWTWENEISIFIEGIGIEGLYLIRKTLKESRAVNLFSYRFSKFMFITIDITMFNQDTLIKSIIKNSPYSYSI